MSLKDLEKDYVDQTDLDREKYEYILDNNNFNI